MIIEPGAINANHGLTGLPPHKALCERLKASGDQGFDATLVHPEHLAGCQKNSHGIKGCVNRTFARRLKIANGAHRSITPLCCTVLLCFLTTTTQLHALISIQNLDDITINGWDGISSNVSGFDDYCVISYTGTAVNPTVRSYDVAMRGASDNGGNFFLEHSTSSATIPVSFTWHHNNGSSWTMKDYNKIGITTGLVPGSLKCNDPNAKVRIKVMISESALQTAPAGIYRSTYQIDGFQTGAGGQHTGFQNFEVTLPELVQISGLDDIFMRGEFNQNIVAKESFCIYRNHSGGVAITSTSLNGANANKFRLRNVNGDFINYKVAYKQQARFKNVKHGQAKTGFVGSPIKDCGGGTNTELRIRVTAANTAGKPGGSYSDTLTILVEPE